MDLNEYADECLEDSMRWFPNQGTEDALYDSALIAGEAGELIGAVKKFRREGRNPSISDWDAVKEELVDVFIYVMRFAGNHGVDLDAEYRRKRKINEERFGS